MPLFSDFSLSAPGGALVVAACLLISISAVTLFAYAVIKGRKDKRLLMTALDHMSQGLCMFDAQQRLIVCNSRYQEMHGLTPEQTRPGTTLRQILESRVARGDYPGEDPERFIRERIDGATRNQAGTALIRLRNGRVLHTVHRPMASGGYVATHEDVTDQERNKQERTALLEQQKRRAVIDGAIGAFRESVEGVLKTVSDSASAMKSTAAVLSNSSIETSVQAVGAVRTSHEASDNVGAAAVTGGETA